MTFFFFLITFLLFFLLSPGVLLRIPPKGGRLVTALVHSLIFAIVINLISHFLHGPMTSGESVKDVLDDIPEMADELYDDVVRTI